MCAEKGDQCDPDNGGDFVVDQASRMDPAAGPGVYAPYGPLYMYTLVSLYCTYQHIGGSLVVPEVHLHEGRENGMQGSADVHALGCKIAGMTSIMTEIGVVE